MENIERIIAERHSVRDYEDRPLEEDVLLKINQLLEEVNREGNLHIQLVLDEPKVFEKFILHYGRLNAKNFLAMVGLDTKDLEERIGYYGEKIVLEAQNLGLNTCWVGGTYSKKFVNVLMEEDEKLVCIIAIGYGKNNGNKRKSKTFQEVSVNDGPSWYQKGVEYALQAPTALNQQKFKFELLDNNIVRLKVGMGPYTKIDKGILKYHFELGASNPFEWEEP